LLEIALLDAPAGTPAEAAEILLLLLLLLVLALLSLLAFPPRVVLPYGMFCKNEGYPPIAREE